MKPTGLRLRAARKTPPDGGTPTTEITNALGQVIERHRHHAATPTGAYDSTAFTYTPAGEIATVTDPSGNQWTTTYDLRGRKVETTDPDKGTTTFAYDDLDRLVSTTDARGETLHTSYDGLDRKTAVREDGPGGSLLSSWNYDTLNYGKGKLASSTRHTSDGDYTSYIRGYDRLGRPTGTATLIPASQGPLAGVYLDSVEHNLDGTVASRGHSAAGGLPSESLVYTYDDLQRPPGWPAPSPAPTPPTSPTSTTPPPAGPSSSSTGPRTRASGRPSTTRTAPAAWNAPPPPAKASRARPAMRSTATPTQAPPPRSPTRPTTASTTGASPTTTYSASPRHGPSPAPPAPADGVIGGPAPYWHTYTYDTAGSRTGETRHGIGGEDDTVRTYTYATPGSDNRMTGVAQTGAAGDSTGSYGYDATGNTTAISTTEGATTSTQTFDWNSEGNLAEVTENGSDTSHIYDADGERLIREDPGGTTLYLPDGTELRRTAGANAVTGTPYYSFGDQTVAMRTSDGTVTYMAVDHQGTAQLAVDATTQQSVVRRFTPFGAIRGFDEDATWPGEKGFVGGTRDPTDLTHLGAREYDPETGRFISVDPIMQLADEASYNGYTYAGNSPVSYSDPAGRCRSGSPACRGVGRNNQHGYYSPGNHAVWQLFRPTPRSYGPSPDRAGAGHFIPALNNIVGRYSGGAAAAPRKPVEKCGFVCKFTNFSVGFGFTLSVSPVVALAFPDNEAKVASWLGADANSSSYKAGGWTVDIAAFCVPGGGLRTAGKGGLKAFLASPFRRCRPNSFLPGTLVLMADGTKKAIQNIRVGGRGAGDRPGNR